MGKREGRGWRAELAAGFALLTRLPWPAPPAPLSPRLVWSFPLVGAACGGLAGFLFALLRALAIPPLAAALVTLAAATLITGALHEDGLADTADALGARGDRARRLDILRDSRIGTFGASALFFSYAGRAAALAALGPAAAARALILAGALGRTALLLQILRLAPARPEGLGARLAPAERAAHALAWALAALIALATLPFATAVPALLIAAGVGAMCVRVSARHFGGFTGDTLGAAAAVTELVLLIFLSRA